MRNRRRQRARRARERRGCCPPQPRRGGTTGAAVDNPMHSGSADCRHENPRPARRHLDTGSARGLWGSLKVVAGAASPEDASTVMWLACASTSARRRFNKRGRPANVPSPPPRPCDDVGQVVVHDVPRGYHSPRLCATTTLAFASAPGLCRRAVTAFCSRGLISWRLLPAGSKLCRQFGGRPGPNSEMRGVPDVAFQASSGRVPRLYDRARDYGVGHGCGGAQSLQCGLVRRRWHELQRAQWQG